MSNHTPTPWVVSPGLIIDTDDMSAYRIATIDSDFPKEINEANAAYIVKAVNAHEDLVNILAALVAKTKKNHHRWAQTDEVKKANAFLAKIGSK